MKITEALQVLLAEASGPQHHDLLDHLGHRPYDLGIQLLLHEFQQFSMGLVPGQWTTFKGLSSRNY